MAKVKYCVTEFTPTANQVGMSHSFNAKVVINSDFDGMVGQMMIKMGRGEEALKAMLEAKLKGQG